MELRTGIASVGDVVVQSAVQHTLLLAGMSGAANGFVG